MLMLGSSVLSVGLVLSQSYTEFSSAQRQHVPVVDLFFNPLHPNVIMHILHTVCSYIS